MQLTKTNSATQVALQFFGQTVLVLLALAVFLFSIVFISDAFQSLSSNSISTLLFATSNPFIGLFIGLLLTAIIQSSSTSTSMIVAIVATGSISLEHAVPMILGANIGTTLTSSLVALGYVNNKSAFRRAISAGVVHDFYNIILTIILLPLELLYGVLSVPAKRLGHYVGQAENIFIGDISLSFLGWMSDISDFIIGLVSVNIIAVILAFITLFLSIKFLSWTIYRRLIGKSKERFKAYLFKNNFKSFLSGLLITSAVQSSSVTTSLVVPLVANRTISLKRIYPFIVGANLGTTITALLAAIFKNEAAISIALIHFGFNFIGAFLLLAIPYLRTLPPRLAKAFSRKVQQYRYIGFVYVIVLFFILPFSLIFFYKKNNSITDNIKQTEIKHNNHVTETLQKQNPN
jgi:sodium-dependent phosphate cotransporter